MGGFCLGFIGVSVGGVLEGRLLLDVGLFVDCMSGVGAMGWELQGGIAQLAESVDGQYGQHLPAWSLLISARAPRPAGLWTSHVVLTLYL